MKQKPELLAPVSDFVSLRAAMDAGADAVYFGSKLLNMRVSAKNFELSDFSEIVRICKAKGVRTYLTVNVIVYDKELERVKRIVSAAKEAGIDAIICWDMAVINECKRQGMTFNVSTQASISNLESARFYEQLGAEAIILARELDLEQISEIKKKMEYVKVEVFIHGAMCVAVSGRCFTSQQLFNRSANRGDCLQPCRRKYLITDIEEPDKKLFLGEDYVLSAKDMCTLPSFEKIIESRVDILKIEGRARSPEYVKTVVSVYRKAIDAYFDNDLNDELKKELMKDLESVYNRGFSEGFYFGMPTEKEFGTPDTKATTLKMHLGKVKNFYKEHNVAEIIIEAEGLKKRDKIMIQGPTTGVKEQTVNSIEVNHKKVESVEKGKSAAVKLDFLVRENDKVYLIKERKN